MIIIVLTLHKLYCSTTKNIYCYKGICTKVISNNQIIRRQFEFCTFRVFWYSIHYREKIDLRKKKEKNKINTIRDEKEDVTTDIIEIEKSGITTNTYLSAK